MIPVWEEVCEMVIKSLHQLTRMIPDSLIGGDKLGIVVAQKGLHARKPVAEVKEHRTTADKRLIITANSRRKKLVELREQSRFPTDPLQKWSRFYALAGQNTGERQCKLNCG